MRNNCVNDNRCKHGRGSCIQMSVLCAFLVSAMEHYGEQSDRKRKAKLNAMELEVLVENAK